MYLDLLVDQLTEFQAQLPQFASDRVPCYLDVESAEGIPQNQLLDIHFVGMFDIVPGLLVHKVGFVVLVEKSQPTTEQGILDPVDL